MSKTEKIKLLNVQICMELDGKQDADRISVAAAHRKDWPTARFWREVSKEHSEAIQSFRESVAALQPKTRRQIQLGL